MRRIKRYLFGLFLLFLVFVLSGCDDLADRNFREAVGEGLKNVFRQTWYIWVIIVIVFSLVGFLVGIAKVRARRKLVKYFGKRFKLKKR